MPFPSLRSPSLRADVVAGLATSAVVVPKAMAYATIAGLPVQVGLFTAFVPMAVYAVLGTSRALSVSTTTTIAILTASELAEVSPGADAGTLIVASATLAVLVGALLVAAGALRLGFVANFISEPVLTGFKCGIGLVIVVDQLPKLFGVHFTKGGFFQNIVALVRHVPETHILTLAIAAGVLLTIVVIEHLAPKAPAALVAVAGAIAISALMTLPAAGVSTVGEVPRGLPSPVWPHWSWWLAMWPGAAGIALMSFTESIAAARAFSAAADPRVQPNRELFAVGAANIAGGFVGAMPAGGGTSQTAVNRRAGAQSQIAELVTASAALLTLLLLAPAIRWLPQAALAAIVVFYSIELVKPAEFTVIRRVRRIEFRWALVALVGVALLGTLRGILVAVVVSLLGLAQQAYHPPVYAVGRKRGTDVFRRLSRDHPDDETWPGLLIVRLEGRAFFANAQLIGDRIGALMQATQPRVVLIDFSSVIDLEYTALKMLTEAEARLRGDGILIWLAALNPEVLRVVQSTDLGAQLGRERMFFTVERALAHYVASP